MTPAEFIITIWSQQPKGWFFLATKSATGRWREEPFKAPTRSELSEFIADNAHHNLYFCPTPFRSPRRIKENVIGSRFLWADLDAAKPEACEPRPQIAWASSPNRYAALWRLNAVHDPRVIEETNKTLTYEIGADPSGWVLTKVLRIPGTQNYKYKDAPKGRLLWFQDNGLPLDDFPDLPPPARAVRSSIRPSGKRKRLPGEIVAMLRRPRYLGPDRSGAFWKVIMTLAECGYGRINIFMMVRRKDFAAKFSDQSIKEQIDEACRRVASRNVASKARSL